MDINSDKNKFKQTLSFILDLPLWVKEVIYLEIKNQFQSLNIYEFLKTKTTQNIYQFHIPEVTFIGKKELELRNKGLGQNVYRFLECVTQGLNIIEITVSNNWNLNETSSCYAFALKNQLVSPPESQFIEANIYYLGGHIRLGEYFVKTGKISLEQLDKVLRAQKSYQETTGEHKVIGEILVKSNLITERDLQLILLLKEESCKIFNFNITGSTTSADDVELLKKENNELKAQIKKILGVG